MATCAFPNLCWFDEADQITSSTLNDLYTSSTAWYSYTTEPEPEPVFDNLGDFLLHKYNKVKEVAC